MAPVFAPENTLQAITTNHQISQNLVDLSYKLRKYYKLESPPKIGFLSSSKREAAFLNIMSDVEDIKEREGLSDADAATLLLSCIVKDPKCRKAMLGFHFEWHAGSGKPEVPRWMALVGYENPVWP